MRISITYAKAMLSFYVNVYSSRNTVQLASDTHTHGEPNISGCGVNNYLKVPTFDVMNVYIKVDPRWASRTSWISSWLILVDECCVKIGTRMDTDGHGMTRPSLLSKGLFQDLPSSELPLDILGLQAEGSRYRLCPKPTLWQIADSGSAHVIHAHFKDVKTASDRSVKIYSSHWNYAAVLVEWKRMLDYSGAWKTCITGPNC